MYECINKIYYDGKVNSENSFDAFFTPAANKKVFFLQARMSSGKTHGNLGKCLLTWYAQD